MEQNEQLLARLNTVTVLSCVAIALIALAFYFYIKNKEGDSKAIIAKKQWIEQIPSMVSTLGVLGTFLGITIGLLHFNTEDLDTSIPLLLSGLRTAFFTSLIGMVGALILNRVVNKAMDEAENSEGERGKQVALLNAVSNMMSAMNSKDNIEFKNTMKATLLGINENIDAVKQSLEAVQTDLEQVKDDIEEIRGHCEEIKESTASLGAADNGEIPKLLAVVSTTAVSIAKIDNDMDAVKESSTAIMDLVQGISSDVETMKKDKSL